MPCRLTAGNSGSLSIDYKKYAARLQQRRPQEGFSRLLFCTVAHTRFSAVGVGGGGPDFVIGKATSRGFRQSVLSKGLKPPVKGSYRKLIVWRVGWLASYTNSITKNSAVVLSPPLTFFALLSAVTFVLLLVLFGRHNQSTHERRYSQWERSFLCRRCGTLMARKQGSICRDCSRRRILSRKSVRHSCSVYPPG